jgi:hypothetical protein
MVSQGIFFFSFLDFGSRDFFAQAVELLGIQPEFCGMEQDDLLRGSVEVHRQLSPTLTDYREHCLVGLGNSGKDLQGVYFGFHFSILQSDGAASLPHEKGFRFLWTRLAESLGQRLFEVGDLLHA